MDAAVSFVQIRCLMNHCAADHIIFFAISWSLPRRARAGRSGI
jgi:hypothetical protein